jgi:DNA-binding response OmpR family regulator
VLVVEDEPFMADLMRELLASDFDVVAVTDPREAFAACGPREPAMIVLDLRLPFIDGEEFAQRWRTRVNGGATPMLVVSARPDAAAVAERIGAVGCLLKPFELGMLERMVEFHLGPEARRVT